MFKLAYLILVTALGLHTFHRAHEQRDLDQKSYADYGTATKADAHYEKKHPNDFGIADQHLPEIPAHNDNDRVDPHSKGEDEQYTRYKHNVDASGYSGNHKTSPSYDSGKHGAHGKYDDEISDEEEHKRDHKEEGKKDHEEEHKNDHNEELNHGASDYSPSHRKSSSGTVGVTDSTGSSAPPGYPSHYDSSYNDEATAPQKQSYQQTPDYSQPQEKESDYGASSQSPPPKKKSHHDLPISLPPQKVESGYETPGAIRFPVPKKHPGYQVHALVPPSVSQQPGNAATGNSPTYIQNLGHQDIGSFPPLQKVPAYDFIASSVPHKEAPGYEAIGAYTSKKADANSHETISPPELDGKYGSSQEDNSPTKTESDYGSSQVNSSSGY